MLGRGDRGLRGGCNVRQGRQGTQRRLEWEAGEAGDSEKAVMLGKGIRGGRNGRQRRD